jgi:hypothetical protein
MKLDLTFTAGGDSSTLSMIAITRSATELLTKSTSDEVIELRVVELSKNLQHVTSHRSC